MFEKLTVAVCQMTSVDDVDVNLMQIENLVERIPVQAGVRIAFFPENCLYLRLIEGEKIRSLPLQDPVFESLSGLAKSRQMHLHLGSVPMMIDGHMYNSSIHISDQGEIKTTYQKMHLFDISLENGPTMRESDIFRHGPAMSILEVDGWRFGETICYDLRFAELFSAYARREVDALLVPSSFLVRTGEAHWEVLLRARAIESQAYLLAAAQSGTHRGMSSGLRETYGNSLIVDPWGEVLSKLSEKGPAVAIQTLDRRRIESVRKQIPMKFHRRLQGV